jgi:hypothetical protein
MQRRRVVTATTSDGAAVFASDEQIEPVTVALIPGGEFHAIWGADRPVALPLDGDPARTADWFPPPDGFRVAFVTIPPQTSGNSADLDLDAAIAELQHKLPGMAETLDPENPGMHTTDTVDFGVVLSGSVWARAQRKRPTGAPRWRLHRSERDSPRLAQPLSGAMRDGRRDHRRNPKWLAEAGRRRHRTVPLSLPAANAEPEIECPTTSHTFPPLITPQTSAHAPNVTESRTTHAPSRLPQTQDPSNPIVARSANASAPPPRSSRPSAQIWRLTPGSAGSAATLSGRRPKACRSAAAKSADRPATGSPEASHKARLGRSWHPSRCERKLRQASPHQARTVDR